MKLFLLPIALAAFALPASHAVGQRRPGVESLVTVERPRQNEVFENGSVTISGVAKAQVVKMQITDSRARVVAKDTLKVRDGRWSTSANLRDGTYRLLVETANKKDRDSRTFRVTGNGGLPDKGSENVVRILYPHEGATVGTRITMSGRSSEGVVSIRVYEGNRVRVDQRVNVRSGKWSLPMSLSAGAHRAVVESQSGRDTDAKRFTVDPRANGVQAGTESLLTVNEPTNGTVFRDGRARFSGTTRSENPVVIEILNSSRKQILKDRLPVSGGRWSSTASLPDGSYTVLIGTAAGRDRDKRVFRVTGGGTLPNEGTESILTIASPRNGSGVASPVIVSGRCKEEAVRIRVYDASNKTVVDEQVNVRSGAYRLSMRLNRGAHRLVVESQSGRDEDALRFTVR